MRQTPYQIGIGADLYVINKDSFKTDYLTFSFAWKPQHETASEYALIPRILANGSETYPSIGAFAKKLDMLYNAGISSGVGKCGEGHVMTFRIRCLERECTPGGEDLFAQTVDVFSDMLLCPKTENGVFRTSVVEREKKNAADHIRADINNKAGYAMKRLASEMFSDEPFGISVRGTLKGLSAVTEKSTWHLYRTMLASAPITCYYVGKRDKDAVISALRPLFERLDRYRTPPFVTPPTIVIRKAKHPTRTVTEDTDAKQSRLCIGYRSGSVLSDGDFYRFALFNELLGGSAVSRLFLELREKRGLCYDIASFPDAQKGILYITMGISHSDFDEAMLAVSDEIERIRRGEFTDEALRGAKKSLISGYREIDDSAMSVASWYENRRYANIFTSPAETAAEVAACTREDVMACASRISCDTVFFLRGTNTEGEEEYGENID